MLLSNWVYRMNTLKNGFVISDAAGVAELMVPHRDIVDGELCGIPITKRGLLLTPTEVTKLRQWAIENVVFGTFVMNEETAKALLGLVPVDPKQTPPFIKIGEVHYASMNNTHNRLLSSARLGDATTPGYTNDMLNRLWGYADPLQVAADAIIASAQHRAGGFVKAKSIDPTLEAIEFPMMVGLPPQFIDFIDRGRERKSSDMTYRDSTMFSPELLAECFAEMPVASDIPRIRQNLSSSIETVRNNVHCRLRGIDVHASGKQLPSKKEALLVDSRFTESDDLQRLLCKVAAIEKGIDGKAAAWSKVWNVGQVATALVLRCNAHHDNPDSLVVDWNYVDAFLAALSESSGSPISGPLGDALGDVLSTKVRLKKDGGGTISSKESFGCLVAAIGQYDASGTTSKVWLDKRTRSAKERNKDKSYRAFGGVDIGYQSKSED